MQTVYKSTGQTQSKFQDQSYFDDFNWFNFSPGDIVWLEDYEGEVNRIAGVFVGYKNPLYATDPIVRLIENRDAKILARNCSQSLLDYNSFWSRKYLETTI